MWRSLLFLVLLCPALAEQPFTFEKAPGRLPKDAVPTRYSMALDFRRAKEGRFSGTGEVTVQVHKPVRELVFNAVGLRIGLGLWQPKGAAPDVLAATVRPVVDDQSQLVKIQFNEEQPAGAYLLQLVWEGKLTEQPEGLFFTRYDTPAGARTAVTTQMEAADARRMFPCWDEPAFRAVFVLSAMVPEHDLAFSNMPLVGETAPKDGFRTVSFAPTPPMPTYLVAFTAGEFETLEDDVEGVHLRMITTPGKKEQARYALEATKQILPYYNQYFGTKYPLPKLDQFCYPGFAAGGMENWGCIHYNDTAMLLDPATATQGNRERVFGVVAHEIAHQWFGDLVTMGWWDNLWLNEGFASWMATKCTDHFNPDWHLAWRSLSARDAAMYRDARSTTHPVQQEVKTEAQAGEAFDEVTYQKGQAILRMLEAYLGEGNFCKGIRGYMAQHAYGNTTTADLWEALGSARGQSVSSMATGWTEQPGFPVVIEERSRVGEAEATILLRQERFTIHQQHPGELTWKIPMEWSRPVPGPETWGYAGLKNRALLREDPIITSYGATPPIKLLNPLGIGFYRVQYDEAAFKQLTELAPSMGEVDRLNLLLDSWALLQAERLGPEAYLGLLSRVAISDEGYLKGELIWPEIIHQLRAMDYLNRGADPKFRPWACALVQHEGNRLGWEPQSDETELTKALRGQVLGALGEWGDAPTLAEAKRRYEAGVENLSPELRPAVLRMVGQEADTARWEELHQRARAESSFDRKDEYYRAMGANRKPALAAKMLELSLTDELPPTQAARLVELVADSAQMPELAWAFARQHADELLAKQPSIRGQGFLPGIARHFNDAAWADELEAFAKEHLSPDATKAVAIATDDIRFKAEFKARFLPELQRFITPAPADSARP